jgi:hypothetical protein
LLCIVSILSAGCPATVSYQPSERAIDELGVSQARQRLRETLLRAINPQVVEAEVTDEYVHYRFRQAIAGFPTGAILDNRVHFSNAARVDVHSNNTVIVRTSAQHPIAQVVFGSPEDARQFADLVTSFRARRARTS